MTYQALLASEMLFKEGIDIEVIHCPTIKPLDSVTIINSVKKTGRVITIEEGQISGGLGGAVSELLGEEYPVPVKRIGVRDSLGSLVAPRN